MKKYVLLVTLFFVLFKNVFCAPPQRLPQLPPQPPAIEYYSALCVEMPAFCITLENYAMRLAELRIVLRKNYATGGYARAIRRFYYDGEVAIRLNIAMDSSLCDELVQLQCVFCEPFMALKTNQISRCFFGKKLSEGDRESARELAMEHGRIVIPRLASDNMLWRLYDFLSRLGLSDGLWCPRRAEFETVTVLLRDFQPCNLQGRVNLEVATTLANVLPGPEHERDLAHSE
jgi:hypothetical protein